MVVSNSTKPLCWPRGHLSWQSHEGWCHCKIHQKRYRKKSEGWGHIWPRVPVWGLKHTHFNGQFTSRSPTDKNTKHAQMTYTCGHILRNNTNSTNANQHVSVFFHDHLQGVLCCALCRYYFSCWFAFFELVLHSMWPHVYVICVCLVFLSVGDLLVTTVDSYGHLKRVQNPNIVKHHSTTLGVHFPSPAL